MPQWFQQAALPLFVLALVLVTTAMLMYSRAREQRLRDAWHKEALRQRTALDASIHALATARDAATVAQQRAESANRAKSLFLANMSHELRTPLNAIIGYSEMLLEDVADMTPDEIASDLRKVTGAGKHLLGLINDVLDFSKIEAGRMDLLLEQVDIGALVRDIEDMSSPVVRKQGNQFVVDSEAGIGSMTADSGKIHQVLLNLLSNAGKFTTNGTITLRARRTASLGEDWIALSVEDSGVGLTREQFGRLFQAFAQADATTQRDHGGTGLGLALCRRFCLMMGGDIEVESKAGHGSTFTVMLPVSGPAAEAQHAATGDAVDDAEPISFQTRMFQIPTVGEAGLPRG